MAWGLSFDTISGRRFRLDEIQPFVYLQSVQITTIGTFYYSYPSLRNLATVYVSCEANDSARDGGKGTTWSYSWNKGTGVLALSTGGALGSGNWSYTRFSIYARFV